MKKSTIKPVTITKQHSQHREEKTALTVVHIAQEFVLDPKRSDNYFIASEEIASKAVAAVKRKINRLIHETVVK